MSVTIEQLKQGGVTTDSLQKIIRDQLSAIDVLLTKCKGMIGNNIVEFELPMTLSLPGIKSKIAQKIVYAGIIESLEQRRFKCRIFLDDVKRKYSLFVRWKVPLDKSKMAEIEKLLAERMLGTEADVTKFYSDPADAGED